MKSKALVAMERTTLVLAVAATCAAGLAWGLEGAGAAALGGSLAFANLTVTRRLAGRAVDRVLAGAHPAAAGLGMGMAIKVVLLFPLLWVAISVLKVPLVPFALGLSVLIVSLVVTGLWTATRGEVA
jgi:ATP synthase I chain